MSYQNCFLSSVRQDSNTSLTRWSSKRKSSVGVSSLSSSIMSPPSEHNIHDYQEGYQAHISGNNNALEGREVAIDDDDIVEDEGKEQQSSKHKSIAKKEAGEYFSDILPAKLYENTSNLILAGEGSSGITLIGDHLIYKQIALKIIKKGKIPAHSWTKNNETGRMIPLEVAMIQILQHHPMICKFFDLMEDGNNFYLITEAFGHSWNSISALNNKSNNSLQIAKENDDNSEMINKVTGGRKSISRDLFECIESNGRLSPSIVKKIFNQLIDIVQHL